MATGIDIEVVNAFHGDCLLLRYEDQDRDTGGDPASRLVLVDGGPLGTFEKTEGPLYDVLEAHRQAQADAAGQEADAFTLPLELVLVSHIDDDHVHGIGNLFSLLAARRAEGGMLPYHPAALWHNAFDDILHNQQILTASATRPAARAASNAAAALLFSQPSAHARLVAEPASVAQGRQLRDDAAAIPVPVNGPFAARGGLAWSLGNGASDRVPLRGGLTLHLISPPRTRLQSLQAEWDRQVKQLGVAQAAAYADRSVFNLSSIVVLAEYGERRILLTGDARGDDILAGLEAGGWLEKGGQMKIDLLKLPHHGSVRDVAPDFFERILADKYVISANGKYDNPDPPTLKMLADARGSDPFTLYQTNRVPEAETMLHQLQEQGARIERIYRDPQQPSLLISL